MLSSHIFPALPSPMQTTWIYPLALIISPGSKKFAASHSHSSNSFDSLQCLWDSKRHQTSSTINIICQQKQKMPNNLYLLLLTHGKSSKLCSRHWLLLNIVQLVEAFVSIHHLLDWCRNCGVDIAITSLTRNPFLWRNHLHHTTRRQARHIYIYKLVLLTNQRKCTSTVQCYGISNNYYDLNFKTWL